MSATLWIAFIISTLSAIFGIVYYVVHANGKKYVRLYASIVLAVFSLLLFMEGEGFILSYYHHTWIYLVLLIPALDTYVDWQLKIKNKKGK